jgi:hypothetical protein
MESGRDYRIYRAQEQALEAELELDGARIARLVEKALVENQGSQSLLDSHQEL